jgi:type IV pilus assembly protein PilQ
MRLKQLLSLMVLLLMCAGMAAAAGSQLTTVGVSSKGNTTMVTLSATGSFTHNEYRPEDRVLLVDLTGVASNTLREKQKALDSAALKSYRVLSYRSANGVEVTRVELSLGDAVSVNVNDAKGQVNLQLVSNSTKAAASPAPAKVEPESAKVVPAKFEDRKQAVPESSGDSLLFISNVAVQRTKAGMAIEISGSSSARAIKLSNPDRIVLDFPGAVPALKNKNISVNSPEIKDIRVARFQLQPPVTRVVIDVASSYEFELVPGKGKLTLKLTGVSDPVSLASAGSSPSAQKLPEPVLSASAKPQAVPMPKDKAPVEVAKAQPAPAPATIVPQQQAPAQQQAQQPPAVVVQPQPQPKQAPVAIAQAQPQTITPSYQQPMSETAGSRANSAAANMRSQQEAPVLQAAVLAKAGPAQNLALMQQQMATPVAAKPKYTGEPISVNVKDLDLKDFFRLINEISGLNIVMDPNVKGSVSMVLNDVPWDQALDIVLQNNGLDRQLEGNVLRIAAVSTLRTEADNRRLQAEAQAQAVQRETVTRFLSYARAADVSATVKKFLSPRGEVTSDLRTNSMIISDIPSVIPEIDRLLAQLDRKSQQVEIEARVVAANRNYVRDLGVQLGFGLGSNSFALGGAPQNADSGLKNSYLQPPPYFTNPGVTPQIITPGQVPQTTSASIPLFSNLPASNVTSGLSFMNVGSTYRLDAILTMAESRGLVKILSRPRVVTQNNIAATVRQGVRLPIVTSAQLGGPPTTTFIDAFLRLTVTPQITVENTVFLAVDVENTTPDQGNAVNGNPALLTQQATTQVLVADGGTVVIGGVIQTQNSVHVDQTPLLGDIPILGNLFKHRSINTSTNELIFFISPRIVQI